MHHPESPVELEVEPLAAKVGRVNVQNKPGSLCQGSFPKLPLSFLFLKVVTNQFCHSLTELNCVTADQVSTLLPEMIHNLTCIVSHD